MAVILPSEVGISVQFRRELLVHCYRILGSLHDAKDLLQETLLAAWRGLSDFERRSWLRSWLYTIATNRCLNALRDSGRRPQAAGLPGVAAVSGRAKNFSEFAWLEPYPDQLLEGIADSAPGPDVRYEAKEAIALAFVSGLQHLAPQQRAVLVLRDVLGFRAGEVAAMLGSSEPSVNSLCSEDGALHRSGLFVVSVRGEQIESITRFRDDGLLSRFGLPARLD